MRSVASRLGRALPMIVGVLAVSSVFASAQTAPAPTSQASPTAPLPSARSILDRHVQAIGGRKAVLSRSSMHGKGTFAVPSAGMSGSLEMFAAKPDRAVVRISLPGVGEIIEGFTGTHAWSVNPMMGPMLAQGKELEQKKFDADFYGELYEDARYKSMTTLEKTEFEGRPAYKLKLVKHDGGEDIVFFDVETGLKAGTIATRETPMGAVTVTASETEYKKFGDVLVATVVKQSMMGTQQVITLETLEFDKVDPSVFEPPAQIKALIK